METHPRRGRSRQKVALQTTGMFLHLVFASGGCSRSDTTAASSTGSADSESRVDALRSLGYVEFAASREDADDDAPDGAIVLDFADTCPGYNLYSNRTECSAHLIDADGNVLNEWKDDTCAHWAATTLLPSGDLVAVGASAENPAGYDQDSFVVRLSWNGAVRWRRTLTAQHDITAFADGFLTLTFDQRREKDTDPDTDIRDNFIVVLDGNGATLSRHSLYEIFRRSENTTVRTDVKPYEMNGEPALDLFHANSVVSLDRPDLRHKHPIFGPGNVLVSMRHQDLIAAIHLPTERVIWSWGRDVCSGQHDASVLDNGNILVFDNGLSRKASRAIEIDPGTAGVVWQYRAPEPTDFFTVAGGNAQRLPNGNTLLVNCDKGHAMEVTPDERIVWEFRNPRRNPAGDRGVIAKMRRYPGEYVDAILKTQRARRSQNLADAASAKP